MVYVIKELLAGDIFLLDKMYDSLSARSKLFLHLRYLGFESVGFAWGLMHFALFLSSLAFIRRVLKRICPFLVVFSLIIVNEENTLIGFSLLKLKGRLNRNGWWGELIMGLRDGYQAKGLGSKLVRATIDQARSEDVQKIFLTTLKKNIHAISFFRKNGFRVIGDAKNKVKWENLRYANLEMLLTTSEFIVTKNHRQRRAKCSCQV